MSKYLNMILICLFAESSVIFVMKVKKELIMVNPSVEKTPLTQKCTFSMCVFCLSTLDYLINVMYGISEMALNEDSYHLVF